LIGGGEKNGFQGKKEDKNAVRRTSGRFEREFRFGGEFVVQFEEEEKYDDGTKIGRKDEEED
jgi:hypothetical protein